mmetsp:Transcript_5890/g.36506  ORF Transcript_5890/g.36506 Transcript_5890/m.36506 type:complete len:188 (+) Transcript_5890:293-856(+)
MEREERSHVGRALGRFVQRTFHGASDVLWNRKVGSERNQTTRRNQEDEEKAFHSFTSSAATDGSTLPPLQGGRVDREVLGRSTWTLLHTLAAQFPEHPTKQQKKDAKTLLDVLTRIYPCGECAHHFQKLVREHPPVVESGDEFARWMCEVHNVVNVRLHKPTFNCERVQARWGKLDCDEGDYCELGG